VSAATVDGRVVSEVGDAAAEQLAEVGAADLVECGGGLRNNGVSGAGVLCGVRVRNLGGAAHPTVLKRVDHEEQGGQVDQPPHAQVPAGPRPARHGGHLRDLPGRLERRGKHHHPRVQP